MLFRSLDALTKLKFNGNFNLWTFIEPCYCLKFFLTHDESVKQEITRMLREDVKSKWHDDDEHQEWIQKILDGESVKNAQEELDRYIEDGVEKEYFWRVNLLDLLRKYSSHRINQSCNQICP